MFKGSEVDVTGKTYPLLGPVSEVEAFRFARAFKLHFGVQPLVFSYTKGWRVRGFNGWTHWLKGHSGVFASGWQFCLDEPVKKKA